jgi:hypothetical protein
LHNDLTFSTNEPDATLFDRFRKTLKDSQFFDILVGYFRTSGFFRLYKSFETIKKIHLRTAVRSGEFLEYNPMYVGTAPVLTASDTQKARIVKWIQAILANPDSPDVPRLEAEINKLVYDLYGLTAKEIEIVEGKNQNYVG